MRFSSLAQNLCRMGLPLFGFLNMPDAKEPEIVVGMGFRCRELVTNPHARLYIDGKDERQGRKLGL